VETAAPAALDKELLLRSFPEGARELEGAAAAAQGRSALLSMAALAGQALGAFSSSSIASQDPLERRPLAT
jgi:hypothetical protein